VYYELANTPELTEYARGKRVYPVSPNTLYAHLQVLLLSFQGKELEDKSREVMRLLRAIGKDYEKLEGELTVLSRHVTNAHNAMTGVAGSFSLLGQKISRSTAFLFEQPKEDKEEA
jgi:DNA recombination protein RmuC